MGAASMGMGLCGRIKFCRKFQLLEKSKPILSNSVFATKHGGIVPTEPRPAPSAVQPLKPHLHAQLPTGAGLTVDPVGQDLGRGGGHPIGAVGL